MIIQIFNYKLKSTTKEKVLETMREKVKHPETLLWWRANETTCTRPPGGQGAPGRGRSQARKEQTGRPILKHLPSCPGYYTCLVPFPQPQRHFTDSYLRERGQCLSCANTLGRPGFTCMVPKESMLIIKSFRWLWHATKFINHMPKLSIQ